MVNGDMKRFLSTLTLLSVLYIGVAAQDGVRKDEFMLDSFPQVQFLWHEYNPNCLKSEDFALRENGVDVLCTIKSIPIEDNVVNTPRTVIVLWEDMASHGKGMADFSLSVLTSFFSSPNLIGDNDEFMVAAYNRHSINDPILKEVTNGFASDREQILNGISSYNRSKSDFSELPQQTDVFPAVNAALEILKRRDGADRAKAIVLITAGRPLSSSATNSPVAVRNLALQYHIPIFAVQYASNHGVSESIKDLAISTYGDFIACSSMDSRSNRMAGFDALYSFYQSIPLNCHGQDYLVTYSSRSKKGSESVELSMSVNGFDYVLSFITPKHSVGSWIKSHVALFVILVLSIVIIIVLIIYFVLRVRKKQRQSAQEMERLREEYNNANQEAEQKIKAQDERFQHFKNAEENRRQNEAKERLAQLMKRKNLNPRLQFKSNGTTQTYVISKVETLIGRSNDCDVIVSGSTVSRHHAKISYTETGFFIEDLGSKNGTIVDGVPVQGPTLLNNHALINMGAELVNFYM